jgi:cation:H+ antiporter
VLPTLPLPLLLVAFLAGAAVVWVASTQLSTQTEILSERWHLGEALAGLLLLAVVEDLPEVVIVINGALSNHLGLISGNLLGGIATQTVLLAIIDATVPSRPLSYYASSISLVLEAMQGIVVFSLVILTTQLPASLHVQRVAPGSLVIAAAWIATTWLVSRARAGLPWRMLPRDPLPPKIEEAKRDQEAEEERVSTRRVIVVFAAAAAAILVAGTALEESSSQMADQLGISGILVGATILALATALPEVSSGCSAARSGDIQLAVSQIFGSNSFLPVLFLPAALLSGQAVLAGAGAAEIYLTGLGLLLTTIVLWGLLFRPSRQFLRLGPDSLVVLLTYLLGMAGLVAIVRLG